MTCPNCGEDAPGGLYSSAYHVLHCGCFYEASPRDVCFHVTSMCDPENRSDWDDLEELER